MIPNLFINAEPYNNNNNHHHHHHLYSHKQLHVHGTYKALSTKLLITLKQM